MATSAERTTAQSLQGKVVLITGGRRVGGELALLMAAQGWRVAMTYHTSRAAIERTIKSVEEEGTEGLAIAADLARPEQAENAVNQVVARFGRLDALVNMASVFRRTPLADLSARDFDDMIAGNLAAPYHTALSAARQMLTQPEIDGIKGKIVVIGDWATDRPYKDYLPYLVAKGGLKTMTLALAKELAPHITVAMIQPAMIDPPPQLTDDDKAAVVAATPLRRVGSPDDVNRLILYLLEGTNFVTGACFRVDGGRFLGEDSC
jgi:pteridine reductase